MTSESSTDERKTIKAYKAFDADWSCRGFKYEVGQTYEHDGEIYMCNSGFHACTVPFDCWVYYEHSETFASVELGGVSDETHNDSKRVAASITITAQLSLPEWIKEQVSVIVDLCRAAKKALASKTEECATATGDRGHAAATGYGGHAAATGDSGHAAVEGEHAIAAAIGIYGTAKAEKGGAIVLAAYDDGWNLVAVRASLVGENGVEPGKTYRLTTNGAFQEVSA